MFAPRKFGQLFALSSAFVGSFVATVTTALTALPVTTTDSVVMTEKLRQQPSVTLASSDTERTRLQQKANVKLEELINVPGIIRLDENSVYDNENSAYSNALSNYNAILRDEYNANVRSLQRLPSKGESIEIRTKDNDVQRLLKQQLNDALEIYQLAGQLIDNKQLDVDLNFSMMPAIQIALAEMNLATNQDARLLASFVCLNIASQWAKNTQAFEQAGVGTRFDVLKANYWLISCEISRMRLGKNDWNSSVISKFQPQQQRPIELEEIKPLQEYERIEDLPIENRERAQQFRRRYNQILKPLISYYNANIRLLKPISRRQSLEIRTEDSDLQKLQKQQLGVAVELNRLQGLRLLAGLPIRSNGREISNPTAEIVLPAIQIALADMNLAINLNERAATNEVGVKIAQTWEKNPVFEEKSALHKRILVLTARYWRRHFEIQKLRTESNSRS